MAAMARVLLVSTLWGIVLGYVFGRIWDAVTVLLGSILTGCILTGVIWLRSPKYEGKERFYRWLNATAWASICAMIAGAMVGVSLLIGSPKVSEIPSGVYLGILVALGTGWVTLAIPVLGPLWMWTLELANGKPQT